MAKKEVSPLKYIEQSISNGESNNSNFIFLSNKDEFYMFFTQEIRHLKSGAEILVTAFDKNQGIDFYIGENKHIEAFMDDWSNKIKSKSLNVKQIVHIYTEKEFLEIKKRAEQYKDCYNYSLGVVTGMPIRPYIDIAVINKSTVLLSFSNDKNSPCDTAFGMAIRNQVVAEEFEKYFNIYWNNDCKIIKNKEGINFNNLNYFKNLSLKTMKYPSFNTYNKLLMQLISLEEDFSDFNYLIDDLHTLSSLDSYWLPKKMAENKTQKLFNEIHNKIMTSYINISAKDVQSIMLNSVAGAKHQIRATSIEIGDDSYWISEDGEAIFTQNIRGITNKGIKVSRIFIMNSSQVGILSDTIERQKSAGVEVMKLITDITTRGTFKDFIIIDDDVVIEIFTQGNAKMFIKKDKIEDYIKRFETYKTQAL